MARIMARTATAGRRLRPVLSRLPVAAGFRDLPGREPTWAERWLEHPRAAGPFWAPMQCAPVPDRITVPVLVGGWHDLFIEQTLEQYRTLSGRGVPARLLAGPWTRLDIGSQAGVAMTESLAWLGRWPPPGAVTQLPVAPAASR
jgi:predicted acyl esterase